MVCCQFMSALGPTPLHKEHCRYFVSALMCLFGRLGLNDPPSLSILLRCFRRRSTSKDLATLVENLRLVSAPPKEKLFGPRPMNARCLNLGQAQESNAKV